MYYNNILLFIERLAIVKAYMQRRYLFLIIGFFVIFSFLLTNAEMPTPVTAQSASTPTPTSVPANRTCGQICNPQYGDTACSNGLNCSMSSILIDNLIPDPVHTLGICATEDLVYQRACMDDIYDGNATIPSCCQVIGDGPTVPNYFTHVSLNEVDELPSAYNAPKVAAYRINSSTKVADCVLDPEIASRKAYKCNGLTEGTDYTYKAIATGKNSNTPNIVSQINGRASSSTIYDLWVTYQNKAVIAPAAPTADQPISLTVSGKKLRSPVALLTVTGIGEGLGSISQEYELESGATTFSKTITIPPLAAGTYKVKFSVAEGYKAVIPASVLTYDAFSFTVSGDTNTPPSDITVTLIPLDPNCPKKSLGDANCDGWINNDDYNIWKSEFTRTINTKGADFNDDQKVTLQDFEIWRKNQEVRQRDE